MQSALVRSATFSLDAILQLFAIACEKPETYGRPLSHWTPRELADEMVLQGVVETISPRHVGRLRRSCITQTAPIWLLVEPPPDPQFDDKVRDICDTYLTALDRAEHRERTICIDEMTGIQAKERLAPELPMRPGKIERQEFEYTRHGTQALIASFDVVSGIVIHPTIGDTRSRCGLCRPCAKNHCHGPQCQSMALDYGLLKHPSIGIPGSLCC